MFVLLFCRTNFIVRHNYGGHQISHEIHRNLHWKLHFNHYFFLSIHHGTLRITAFTTRFWKQPRHPVSGTSCSYSPQTATDSQRWKTGDHVSDSSHQGKGRSQRISGRDCMQGVCPLGYVFYRGVLEESGCCVFCVDRYVVLVQQSSSQVHSRPSLLDAGENFWKANFCVLLCDNCPLIFEHNVTMCQLVENKVYNSTFTS